jgi:hypothetical protein
LKRSKNIFAKPTPSEFCIQLAVLILGIIIGIVVTGYKQFEFDWKFNTTEILTILLGLVFTFYLQNAVSGRAEADKVEKELIIGQARAVVNRLKEIGDLCRESALGGLTAGEARVVLGDFKKLSGEIRSMKLAVVAAGLPVEVDRCDAIQRLALTLKQRVTGNAFPSQPLTSAENSQIQTGIHELEERLLKFIFHVNRV